MGADEIFVRTYEDRDREAVAALWSVVFPNDPPWNEPVLFIHRKRSMQPQLFWVAQEGDQIIGTVVAGYDGVRGWIYHLAVHPSKRRMGTARRLMQAAEGALMALGCPKINLQVRADNTPAIDFYTLLGYGAEDRVSMGKPLHDRRPGQERSQH
ncbi:MAG TPA: GNAT family acetyltransferase [Bryobacteraceae bacterium]|nr:GNAT family acetyltransferase [Bryobacteraceae bacterium]